jgi:hypothetical protein
MSNKKCGNCAKHASVINESKAIQLVCRARPPVVTVAIVPIPNGTFRTVQANNWPHVTQDDWCAEFEPELMH